MPVREILQLGHPALHEVCAPVRRDEVDALRPVVQDLHDTLMDFLRRYDAGRAIDGTSFALRSQRHHLT